MQNLVPLEIGLRDFFPLPKKFKKQAIPGMI